MLQRFLAGMPTKPVLVIAPSIMILVLSLYYYGRYQTCSTQANFRDHFITSIEVASKSANGELIIRPIVGNFEWDTLQIIKNYQPELKQIPNCSFGWDWSQKKLQTLAEQQRLTMLVFLTKGNIAKYVELDRSSINFSQVKQSYQANEAKFRVHQNNAANTITVHEW